MGMFRLSLCLCLVACGGPSAPPPSKPVVSAPSPRPRPGSPEVGPRLDAQGKFALWLEGFNAKDEGALAAFARDHFTPELARDFPGASELLGFRESTGGFEVKKTEEVAPARYVAIIKERGADQYARAVLELDDATRVRAFQLGMIPTPADFQPARLSEDEAIAALRTELDALVARDQFSGAVLVARNGKPVFTQAYGMADRANQLANTVDTRFRIGSMNKMFTATAILQLVQRKKLRVEDTVGKHLTDYPNRDVAAKVKLHHLLTHTGGTGDIFGPEYAARRLELRTLRDYVKLYGNRELVHEPGADSKYSNYGFVLLGVIIEKVTRKSYYDHLAAAIFKPARMTSTSSPFEDEPMKGRAIAYTKGPGAGKTTGWADAKDTLPIRATSAGGGDSTVGDLLRFANALTANQLLDERHTELLISRKTGQPGGGYAYGFGVSSQDGIDCFGHGGGAPGMNGDLQICSNGYTIVVLANLDPPAAGRVVKFLKQRLPKSPSPATVIAPGPGR